MILQASTIIGLILIAGLFIALYFSNLLINRKISEAVDRHRYRMALNPGLFIFFISVTGVVYICDRLIKKEIDFIFLLLAIAWLFGVYTIWKQGRKVLRLARNLLKLKGKALMEQFEPF